MKRMRASFRHPHLCLVPPRLQGQGGMAKQGSSFSSNGETLLYEFARSLSSSGRGQGGKASGLTIIVAIYVLVHFLFVF